MRPHILHRARSVVQILEQPPHDFAGRGNGHLLHELHRARQLVRREVALGLGTLAAALLVAMPSLRLRGLYFSVATLAFAEMVRLLFEVFNYQLEIDGEWVGPLGSEGFRDIRYIYENDISSFQYMLLIYALLAAVMMALVTMERSRFGLVLRMIGEDPVLARLQGINVTRYKLAAVVVAGAMAGIGGGLYAHLNTYVEPKIFNVMLGVHGLAYGLIGGLGTAFGPLIGVLESTRFFSGYRASVAGERAKAHVDCTATHSKLVYHCTMMLMGKKSGQPIESDDVTVKADMPSMPMAHNLRPAKASPVAGKPGTYEMHLDLEMLGEWALAIEVDGRTQANGEKVRDKVIVKRHFGESDAAHAKHSGHGDGKNKE